MKNILNNKFFIIIFLFVILTFSICTNCFAIDFTLNNKTYSVTTTYNGNELPKYKKYAYVVAGFSSDNSTILYIGDFDASNYNNLYIKRCDNIQGYDPIYVWYTKDINGEENLVCYYVYKYILRNDTFVYDYRTGMPVTLNNYYISTQDIYDKNNNLVFQVAPRRVEQVTIPTITQVQEIPQTMNKVLEMIIPIGLIIFGIGLIIYLVQLVISRMT